MMRSVGQTILLEPPSPNANASDLDFSDCEVYSNGPDGPSLTPFRKRKGDVSSEIEKEMMKVIEGINVECLDGVIVSELAEIFRGYIATCEAETLSDTSKSTSPFPHLPPSSSHPFWLSLLSRFHSPSLLSLSSPHVPLMYENLGEAARDRVCSRVEGVFGNFFRGIDVFKAGEERDGRSLYVGSLFASSSENSLALSTLSISHILVISPFPPSSAARGVTSVIRSVGREDSDVILESVLKLDSQSQGEGGNLLVVDDVGDNRYAVTTVAGFLMMNEGVGVEGVRGGRVQGRLQGVGVEESWLEEVEAVVRRNGQDSASSRNGGDASRDKGSACGGSNVIENDGSRHGCMAGGGLRTKRNLSMSKFPANNVFPSDTTTAVTTTQMKTFVAAPHIAAVDGANDDSPKRTKFAQSSVDPPGLMLGEGDFGDPETYRDGNSQTVSLRGVSVDGKKNGGWFLTRFLCVSHSFRFCFP